MHVSQKGCLALQLPGLAAQHSSNAGSKCVYCISHASYVQLDAEHKLHHHCLVLNTLARPLVCLAGMVTVMDGPETGPFNIGNPTEFTMLELAKMVQEVVNPDVKIVYKENTADDPSRRKPDITKVMPAAVFRMLTYTCMCYICYSSGKNACYFSLHATLSATLRHTSLHPMATTSMAAVAFAPLQLSQLCMPQNETHMLFHHLRSSIPMHMAVQTALPAAAAAALHLPMLWFICKLLHNLSEQSLHILCLHAGGCRQTLHTVIAINVNTSIQVKKTLGWEPVVPLKEGLALMVEDFAHRLGQCTASLLAHCLTLNSCGSGSTPSMCASFSCLEELVGSLT